MEASAIDRVLRGYRGYGMEVHYGVLLMQSQNSVKISKKTNGTKSNIREIVDEGINLQADHKESKSFFRRVIIKIRSMFAQGKKL